MNLPSQLDVSSQILRNCDENNIFLHTMSPYCVPQTAKSSEELQVLDRQDSFFARDTYNKVVGSLSPMSIRELSSSGVTAPMDNTGGVLEFDFKHVGLVTSCQRDEHPGWELKTFKGTSQTYRIKEIQWQTRLKAFSVGPKLFYKYLAGAIRASRIVLLRYLPRSPPIFYYSSIRTSSHRSSHWHHERATHLWRALSCSFDTEFYHDDESDRMGRWLRQKEFEFSIKSKKVWDMKNEHPLQPFWAGFAVIDP